MSRLPALIMLVVLALMVGGGAAMLLLAPATEYSVACTRTPPARCELSQGRRLEMGAHRRRPVVIPLDSVAAASVRVDDSPPRLLGTLSWLGLIVAALLIVLAGLRISKVKSGGVEMDHYRMPTP